jgi:hypothetical protein
MGSMVRKIVEVRREVSDIDELYTELKEETEGLGLSKQLEKVVRWRALHVFRSRLRPTYPTPTASRLFPAA